MQLIKKIIALFCVNAILFSCLVIPTLAVEIGEIGGLVSGVADFGQWAIDSTIYGIKLVGRIFDEDVCPERPGGVNTTHSFVINTTTKDGVLGDWYVCEYCGFNSGYQANSESLSAAYDTYVQDLPATGYTSTGGLLWQPTASDVTPVSFFPCFKQSAPISNDYFSTIPYSADSDYYRNLKIDFLSNGNGLSLTAGSEQTRRYVGVGFELKFSVPLSGSYRRTVSPQSLCNLVVSTGLLGPVTSSYTVSSFSHVSAGETISDKLS